MVRRQLLILWSFMVIPAAAWAQAPSPKGGTVQEAAKPGAGKASAEAESFQAAMKVIATSMDTNDLVEAMAVLRKGYPQSRPVLVDAVEKGAVKTKTFAIQVLGEHGKAEVDMPIVVPTLKDSREKVRLAAVMAIRRLGKTGLKAMLEYLPREESANNRKMAIKTLQQWNDLSACPPLVRMLKTEKDEGVQSFIVTALEFMTRKKLGNDVGAWEAYIEQKALNEQFEQLRAKDGAKGEKEAAKP
jgi:HEAT repeat protein